MKPPYTIRCIIDQSGGFGMRGAFAYVGASHFNHKCKDVEHECRPSKQSELRTDPSKPWPFVDFEVGLMFKVNGKRDEEWHMVVTYEPDDTYSVWLVRGDAKRQGTDTVIACHRDVYCDNLKDVIENAYDQAINDRCGGFIPLS